MDLDLVDGVPIRLADPVTVGALFDERAQENRSPILRVIGHR